MNTETYIEIAASREGYSIGQIYNTLTLDELINILEYKREMFGGDCPVYLSHDGGYTYGGITSEKITAEDLPSNELEISDENDE